MNKRFHFDGDFFYRISRVQNQLSSLLGITIVPSARNSFIEERLLRDVNHIKNLHDQGRHAGRDYHINRLAIFAKHLSEVRSADKELFNAFKSELRSASAEDYFGLRLEVDTAASLYRKGLSFTHPDPPDFRVQTQYGTVGIECKSGHLAGGDRTIEEKFKDLIIEKSGKPYYNESNILFVDLTNIFYNTMLRVQDDSLEFDIDQLRTWSEEAIENFALEIGGILLFTYQTDDGSDDDGIWHDYVRIDNSDREARVTNFLDEHYPFEKTTKNSPWYPSQP